MAKVGDTIRILALAPNEDGTHDPTEQIYVGKTGKVTAIHDDGSISGTWGGINLLSVDFYEIVSEA